MRKVSRRAFVAGGVAAATSLTLGISASKGVRRHGPVEIRTYFFSKDPIVLEASLLADDQRDLFRILIQVEPKDPPVVVEMSLSGMRKAMRTGSENFPMVVTAVRCPKPIRELVTAKVDSENVTFLCRGSRDFDEPVWLKRPDVLKIL